MPPDDGEVLSGGAGLHLLPRTSTHWRHFCRPSCFCRPRSVEINDALLLWVHAEPEPEAAVVEAVVAELRRRLGEP